MTDTVDAGKPRLPWHFWLVCVIAVLWNGFGGYDYTMSMTQGDAYLRGMGMTDLQIEYYHGMPGWVVGAWAIGVWAAVLGTVLMLVRSKWALHAFVASLGGLSASLIYAYLLSKGSELMGQMGVIMNSVIAAGCLFFIWYAWTATKKGILR